MGHFALLEEVFHPDEINILKREWNKRDLDDLEH